MGSRKGAFYRVKPKVLPKACSKGHTGWMVFYHFYDYKKGRYYRGIRCDECARIKSAEASRKRRFKQAIRKIFVTEVPY